MNLFARLQCPCCDGRLAPASGHALHCSQCGRAISFVDGIADFVSELLPLPSHADRYVGVTSDHGVLGADLPIRIKHAAGARWPSSLGDTIEFGCGRGLMTHAVVAGETFRSMIVLDTDTSMLAACHARIKADEFNERPVLFAAAGGDQRIIRDAVADTAVGAATLTAIGDVRPFLTMVHRVLKPGGRAIFVVPNRRYFQAICLAMAEALTQRFAQDDIWPDGSWPVMKFVAETRRMILNREDQAVLSHVEQKHLFDSDVLEGIGREIGFATAEAIPLDPDTAGAETLRRICLEAGAPDGFAREFGPLAALAGHHFLNLLNYRDSSAFSLLWLSKAAGPEVRVYTGRPVEPPIAYSGPESALGGIQPRWSIELLARDTPDGVVVKVDGWCISNVDALRIRITLNDVVRHTPVGHYRPDVHEVLNRQRLYHPLNALCGGIEEELLFAGVHPEAVGCLFRLDIILTGGLIISAPAPARLSIDQSLVIAH